MNESDDAIRAAIRRSFRAGKLAVFGVRDGRVVEAPVADVLRHYTPQKRVILLVTAQGSVSVTEDHSVFRYLEGRSEPVPASLLSVGMQLAVVRDEEVHGAPITEVREEESCQYTYDLSVPGPESFVLANGIVAHNSYSIGGVSLDLEKSSKYESAYQAASDLFDKQVEKAKQTVNVVRGLQQPRFGVGVRSSFGPFTGRGIMSPAKYFR